MESGVRTGVVRRRMSYSIRIAACVVGWLASICPVFADGNWNADLRSDDKRPNIVFVFSDDHACHAIGAYNGWLQSLNPTPHIDRLARQGMLFQNSFCTNSICGPSRAVILTGQFSHLNGFMRNGDKFDATQPTFPKRLQAAGYQTAMIGKWHLKSEPRGFDHWDVLPGQGDYYNPTLINADGQRKIEGYCTDIVTELALDWLKENGDGEKPFLLMCQHKAPHRNWMPPLRHLDLYNDAQIPVPSTLFDTQQDNARCVQLEEMEVDRHLDLVNDLFAVDEAVEDARTGQFQDRSGARNLKTMNPRQLAAWQAAYEAENRQLLASRPQGDDLVRWKYQRYIKNYLRCVRGVDDSVGQLLEYLDQSGLRDNTIVIYCSDQGFYLGDHGWYDKRFMYEESLKMPLIVSWPNVTRPGSVNTDLVQNLDYAETFLDLAGVEIPANMQGRSLVPLLRGQTPTDWRQAIYYHYYEFPGVHMVARHYGIRDQHYKLIHFYQFDEWEFYDLQMDPDESTNRYDDPQYETTIARLKSELNDLRRQYRDDSDVSVGSAEWQTQMLDRADTNR